MAVRVAINGFGRIGRYMLRLLAQDKDCPLVAINARGDNKTLAHLFKYDSVHGTFAGDVSYDDKGMIINGQHIAITRSENGKWAWKELGIDIVAETTGAIRDRAGLLQHLECGAKKVVLGAPGKEMDATIVVGANHDTYEPAKHHLVSNASCTTNCLAPAAKIVHETFGIEHGLMTTIHSYTMSQNIVDGSHKDLRRARAAAVSMIPTTTGAAKATALVVPALKGKLDGMAIRVPTPNVSLVDLTCELSRDTTAEEVNAALKAASGQEFYKASLGYTDIPLVSCDYTGSTYGGVVDSLCTTVLDKRLLKLIIWYDNEAGFSNQLTRLIRLVAKKL